MNRTQAIQILMLNSDASFDDVKYAYRKLSLELHPDRNKNESDGRRFKNVLDAYHFLKSQSRLKNSHYDDKTTMKKSRTYQNTAKQNPPEEDWGKFTKDFEMDENFWRHYEKSFWEEIKRRELAFISSTLTTAVALDVCPTIVSPFTKEPVVVSSVKTLLV